ncbi:uncharacterized protein FOMMEDRAFT_149406 [Fomitiporia mediterranea MF3/22]|uniref:uncharacterized protein n=1 Tax=Fomitiporia mediterranea (strain MF3/22) TaxID=694068 RepID=UPI00044078DC|nr:uncharacterized protein FOMMEDRAFT_149406 [Fomitiporia mediterranea MF3/22]EJC97938.1 hypothetical protein FOMMEDRAFT_149406 [Fomitiporia mediterranea MF3/22]
MAKEFCHKHARQDLKLLLEERNQQNAFLRAQLAARIEHTAHLETRLLSTLDTLDELQASATRDLEQAHRENALLVKKLDVCDAIARAADREKGDMSNAVLQLVAKVESCNDYSKWRASRIEFSHDITLHPVRPSKTNRGQPSVDDLAECTCAHAYLPAVVEELSDSLAREKRAHTLSIEEAERRIAALQSRVAARDAEIARRMAICRCLPTSSTLEASTHLELISEEEQANVATRTAAMDRVLESDIAAIEKKFRRERRTHKTLRQVDQSIQTDPGTLRSFGPSRATGSDPLANPVTKENNDDEIPVALNALNSQIVHLREKLNDLVAEKETLREILHDELGMQDPETLLRHQKQRITENSIGKDTDANADGFARDERNTKFKDILLLEEECIRLMRSEESLNNRLVQLQHREARLSEENARMREEISRLRSAETRVDNQPPATSLPPLDISAVDLAFPPLQPDAISPVYARACEGDNTLPIPSHRRGRTGSSSSASSSCPPATPTSLIDPSEIPLPITPTFDDAEGEGEPDDDRIAREQDSPYPSITDTPSPELPQRSVSPLRLESPTPAAGARNAEVIARELADTRADAEMRDREIEEVRELMEDLVTRVNNEMRGR